MSSRIDRPVWKVEIGTLEPHSRSRPAQLSPREHRELAEESRPRPEPPPHVHVSRQWQLQLISHYVTLACYTSRYTAISRQTSMAIGFIECGMSTSNTVAGQEIPFQGHHCRSSRGRRIFHPRMSWRCRMFAIHPSSTSPNPHLTSITPSQCPSRNLPALAALLLQAVSGLRSRGCAAGHEYLPPLYMASSAYNLYESRVLVPRRAQTLSLLCLHYA